MFRSLSATSIGKLSYQLSPGVLTSAFPFGAIKPEKAEIGRLDTPFGTVDVSVSYRKDVSFALQLRQEVIPAESIIPDYAPSLGSKIPIRTSTKPVSIQRHSSVSGPSSERNGGGGMGARGRSNTAAGVRPSRTTEARSQPALLEHDRLSFSPPAVGATSMWSTNGERSGGGGGAVQSSSAGREAVGPRDRQHSEPPFPSFTPSSVGATAGFSASPSPRVPAYSVSPHAPDEALASLPRTSAGDGERVLTAVSPPSFSQVCVCLCVWRFV